MTMNKQTVWLVTMLTLMVVLSAYYIVTGPVEPAQKLASKKNDQNSGNIEVNIKNIDPATATKNKAAMEQKNADDYFVAYQLQRGTLRQKMTEDYMKILSNPDSSKEELSSAKVKIDQLMKIDKHETVLEDMIRKEGYRDAVVVTNDPHVDVVVQSDHLTKAQVVKLISIVKQQLNVSPNHVSIAYRP